MFPEAMNAAARVNNPVAIKSPATNSIKPAYQAGHAPTSTGTAEGTGQPKRIVEPYAAKSRPYTNRKRLRTAGAYLDSFELRFRVTIPYVTVATQSSSRRHNRCRLDAMLWQCALPGSTTVVMSGLLQYTAASARGSGDTSTTP